MQIHCLLQFLSKIFMKAIFEQLNWKISVFLLKTSNFFLTVIWSVWISLKLRKCLEGLPYRVQNLAAIKIAKKIYLQGRPISKIFCPSCFLIKPHGLSEFRSNRCMFKGSCLTSPKYRSMRGTPRDWPRAIIFCDTFFIDGIQILCEFQLN